MQRFAFSDVYMIFYLYPNTQRNFLLVEPFKSLFIKKISFHKVLWIQFNTPKHSHARTLSGIVSGYHFLPLATGIPLASGVGPPGPPPDTLPCGGVVKGYPFNRHISHIISGLIYRDRSLLSWSDQKEKKNRL